MSNITTQTLKRCKSQVLKRYYSILCFIGWRPFYKEDFYKMPWIITILNIIYPIIIISLLFFAYTYEVLTCQGKLNVAKDSFITAIPIIPAHHTNKSIVDSLTTKSSNNLFFNNKYLSSTPGNLTINDSEQHKDREQCGHVFTTYIVPSVMHLASYILGFIFFRINENETLYAYEKILYFFFKSNVI